MVPSIGARIHDSARFRSSLIPRDKLLTEGITETVGRVSRVGHVHGLDWPSGWNAGVAQKKEKCIIVPTPLVLPLETAPASRTLVRRSLSAPQARSQGWVQHLLITRRIPTDS